MRRAKNEHFPSGGAFARTIDMGDFDRPRSFKRIGTEGRKSLLTWRGTDGSNRLPSSRELAKTLIVRDR